MTGEDYKHGDITPGGSRIIEGKQPDEDLKHPDTAAEHVDFISGHLEPVLGKTETVFHEIISDTIHLDVLVFPPNKKRDAWIYVTSGMSDLRMSMPEGLDPAEWSRAELMIGVPKDWGKKISVLMNGNDEEDHESIFWPVSLLKWMSRYPHLAGTWLGPGHTIPTNVEEPYKTKGRFKGVLIDFAYLLPEEKLRPTLPNGDHLNFYGVTLLYPEEMDYKLNKGYEALANRLYKNGVSEVIDLNRRSVVSKHTFLRLLGRG